MPINNNSNDYYNNISEFIPIASHVNNNTLITKNSELIQIIKIQNLKNTDNIEINKIIAQIIDSNCAVWINTIREKKDKLPLAPNNSHFANKLQDIFKENNKVSNIYVNTIYISIIYKPIIFKINNISSIINSLAINRLNKFHNQYIENSCNILNKITEKINDSLKKYQSTILEIKETKENTISEPLELFNKILNLNSDDTELDIQCLSTLLKKSKMQVEKDKIHIINKNKTKTIFMISTKGFQKKDYLDKINNIFNLPIEIIATEVLYPIKKEDINNIYSKGKKELLELSKEYSNSNNLNKTLQDTEQLYNQEIIIMGVSDNNNDFNDDVTMISNTLYNQGIIHVQEDVGIENAYWSQLPSNFNFLHRIYPTKIDNICAFTNISQENISETNKNYITIFPNFSYNTPYFFKFYDKNHEGNTLIIGDLEFNSNLITNFLLSESLKYKPEILYFVTNNHEEEFIKNIEGEVIKNIEDSKNLIYSSSNQENEILNLIIKIIFNKKQKDLTKEEIKIIQDFTKIITKNSDPKIIQDAIEKYKFTNANNYIKEYLLLLSSEKYINLFKNNNKKINNNDITGINLQNIYNTNIKELSTEGTNYINNNDKINLITTEIINKIINNFSTKNKKEKIIVLNNFIEIFSKKLLNYNSLIEILLLAKKHNTIIIVSGHLTDYKILSDENDMKSFFNLFNTNIIINPIQPILQKNLNIKQNIINKIHETKNPDVIPFIVKQNNNYDLLKLNITNLDKILYTNFSKE